MIDIYEWRKQDLKRINREIAEWKRSEPWHIVKLLRKSATLDGSYGYGFDRVVYKLQNATLKKLRRYVMMYSNKTDKMNRITQDMIDRAADHPIENLFPDAHRGMVRCFLHDDKRPSASLKNNRFKCWVCNNKPYNPIDVLRYRDNLTFQEAVLKLI